MKFEFTDSAGIRYQFELNPEPEIKNHHVEVMVYWRPTSAGSVTIRPIVDDKVKWYNIDDDLMISDEARKYLDRVIKNKVFL
jgi:hypothetical protein